MSTWWGFVIPANWFSRPWKVLRGFSILDHLWGIYSVNVDTPTISSPKVPSSGKIGKEVFSTPCHKVFNFSHSTFGHDLVPPWSRSQHLNASRLWQKHLLFYGNTPLCGAMTPTMGSDDTILYNFVWRSSCLLLRFFLLPSELPALEMPFGGQFWGGQFWVCHSSELPALSIFFCVCWYALQIVLCVV